MMHLGASDIILVAEPEAALALKAEKDRLAVGEVGGALSQQAGRTS